MIVKTASTFTDKTPAPDSGIGELLNGVNIEYHGPGLMDSIEMLLLFLFAVSCFGCWLTIKFGGRVKLSKS